MHPLVSRRPLLPLVLCAWACGPARPPAAPPPPAAAPITPSHLAFSPSGDRLIVDARWIVPAEDGALLEVAAGEGRPVFAADGRIAWLAAGALRIDGQRIALPAMQHPPVADQELVGLWLDLDRLYLHEWHPLKQTAACRIFDRRTAGLRAPAQCLDVQHPQRLEAGPGDLLAIVEDQPAGPVLRVVRYSPDEGTGALLRFDLRPDGAVAVAFAPDGGRVRLVSACDLTRPRPCAGPSRLGEPWLFEYDVLAGRLERHLAVRPGAVPGPNARLAWPIPGGVCLAAHPQATGRCRSLVSTP